MLFLQSNSKLQGIVMAEKTRLSEQYYSALQKFVVLELGLTLLPVVGPAEAAQLIEQMVSHRLWQSVGHSLCHGSCLLHDQKYTTLDHQTYELVL